MTRVWSNHSKVLYYLYSRHVLFHFSKISQRNRHETNCQFNLLPNKALWNLSLSLITIIMVVTCKTLQYTGLTCQWSKCILLIVTFPSKRLLGQPNRIWENNLCCKRWSSARTSAPLFLKVGNRWRWIARLKSFSSWRRRKNPDTVDSAACSSPRAV